MRIVANTVYAVVYRRERRGTLFLLLRRAPARGGFWQSVSGTVRRGERAEGAAARETIEETGRPVKRVLSLDLIQTFYDDGWIYLEPSFGIEVGEGPVVLGREHVEHRWVRAREATRLLRWPGNRAALACLVEARERIST